MISDQVVNQHVRRLLNMLDPVVRDALALNPQQAAEDHLGVEVRLEQATRQTSNSLCPIDGIYLHEEQIIVVAVSQSPGRTLFSILHEVGHHLIEQDDEVTDLLWDAKGQRSTWAREKFANELAANLLLHEELVSRHIPEQGPTARGVIALINHGKASAEACAVAAARRLPGNGYVVIAEHDGTVRFAASHGSALPIARHTPQPRHNLLERAANGSERQHGATLAFSGGTLTDPMHADAAPFRSGAIGVYTDGKAPWVRLSVLPRPEFESFDVDCPRCHDIVQTYKGACRECGTHKCEECGWCDCHITEQDEELCHECFTVKPTRIVEDSICRDCR